MSLLLAIADGADLGVRQNPDDSAVLLELLKLCLDPFPAICVFSGVLGKCLLLGFVPAFVTSIGNYASDNASGIATLTRTHSGACNNQRRGLHKRSSA